MHDTVEDTDTTIDEIREKFGDDIAGLYDFTLDTMTFLNAFLLSKLYVKYRILPQSMF